MVAGGARRNVERILDPGGERLHAGPVGFAIVDGRAQMVDFGALLLNSRAWYPVRHTIAAGLVTAAFFMLGISVYHLVKKTEEDAFKLSFRLAAIVAVHCHDLGGGDRDTRRDVLLREVQPMAAAASEAHYETQDPADWSMVALFDKTGKEGDLGDQDPQGVELAVLLQVFRRGGRHQQRPGDGMKQQYGPGDYVPLVALDYWMFRVMVGLGFLMVGLALVALLYARKFPPKWLKAMRWLTHRHSAAVPGEHRRLAADRERAPAVDRDRVDENRGRRLPQPHPCHRADQPGRFRAGIYGLLMIFDVVLLRKFARMGLAAPRWKRCRWTTP